jgi:hypothetical protein
VYLRARNHETHRYRRKGLVIEPLHQSFEAIHCQLWAKSAAKINSQALWVHVRKGWSSLSADERMLLFEPRISSGSTYQSSESSSQLDMRYSLIGCQHQSWFSTRNRFFEWVSWWRRKYYLTRQVLGKSPLSAHRACSNQNRSWQPIGPLVQCSGRCVERRPRLS